MEDWAFGCIGKILTGEMNRVASHLKSTKKELSKDHLLGVNLRTLIETMKATAPRLWATLHGPAYTPKQEKRNTMKNPDWVSIIVIRMFVIGFECVAYS